VSTDYLKLLAGGVKPAALDRSPLAQLGRADIGPTSFSTLLDQAKSGAIDSGMPVSIARNAGVELSDEQLTRLASAVDRAEAAGASRALVHLDGMWLAVDVGTRQVTGIEKLDPLKAATGIDTVIRAPQRDADHASAALLGPPAAMHNTNLLGLLAQR